MADRFGCFGKTPKQTGKKFQKEKNGRSKILLGDMSGIKSSVRALYELALPENLPKCGIFFSPIEATPKLRFERQTFPHWKVQREFEKLHYRQRIRAKKRKIYILPIGPFPDFVLEKIPGLTTSLFELLSNFVSVYYMGFSVEVLDAVDLNEKSCRTRIHPGTGKQQILVGDVISYLKKTIPKDGYCMVGISWQDLYPGDEWNFVLGEASSEDGCAAVSFGHHEPKALEKLCTLNTLHNKTSCVGDMVTITDRREKTPHDRNTGPYSLLSNEQLKEHTKLNIANNKEIKTEDNISAQTVTFTSPKTNAQKIEGSALEKDSGLIHVEDDSQKYCGHSKKNFGEVEKINVSEIWKFLRVVSHELGHIFGLTHCSFFSCAMNESTSVEEAVNQPLFMCPVCLRKIQKATGFDVEERYIRLRHFLETLRSDLIQEEMKGKHQNHGNITGNDSTNHNNREIENFTKAIAWIDSILIFLEKE